MPTNLKKSLLLTLHFPPQIGGEQVFYYNICSNLPADKIVVLAPPDRRTKQFDLKQHIPILRSKNLGGFLKTGSKKQLLRGLIIIRKKSLVKEVKHVIARHGIEVIQIGQILPLGALALTLRKQTGIPYVVYAHGLDLNRARRIPRKSLLIQKIIKQAQACIANSNFTKDLFIALGAPPEKVIVAYPGTTVALVDVPDWRMASFRKRHELIDKKILLTVGRLIKRKGHDMVIKALPLIRKQVPEATYVIAGDGPQHHALQRLVHQLKLGNYVRFLGVVDQTELSLLFHASELLIMPNQELKNGDVEGFGLVFLEASLFGKPVIGGRNGGVPEAVLDRRTGLLVNPVDHFEISQAAIKLLTDHTYAAKLGLQGLERTTEQFDWKKTVQTISKILT